MNSNYKVTIETPEEKYEFSCDFIASVMITMTPLGLDNKLLARGDLSQKGILTALDSLRQLEEILLSRIPMPREMVEELLKEKRDKRRTDSMPESSEKDQNLVGEMLKAIIGTAQKNKDLFPDNRTNL